MNTIQIILIGLLYYCGSSFWLDGWITVNHHLIGGFFVSIILKQPLLGCYYGAILQLMFMGWLRMGVSSNNDGCFAGIVVTALAINNNLDIGSVCLLAFFLSLLTRNIWI